MNFSSAEEQVMRTLRQIGWLARTADKKNDRFVSKILL